MKVQVELSKNNLHVFENTLQIKFKETTVQDRKDKSLSDFDLLLQQLWNEKMDKGYFRYKFRSIDDDYKIIDSNQNLPYLVHINEARYIRYEKPKKIPFKTIDEEFNLEKFSFLKIKRNEILFKLSGSSNQFSNDYVIINSAPLEFGHVLLIPEIKLKHRQSLTLHALQSALHLLQLSGSIHFKLMFNSLQGGASVNHLHIHGMYSRFLKLSDNLARIEISGSKSIYKTKNAINPGYIISDLTENTEEKLKNIHKLVQFFEDRQIAHNMTMFYNCQSMLPEVVIWPRKSLIELNNSNPFEIAVSEISGHLIYKYRPDFQNANLEIIETHLKSAVLEDSEYKIIEDWINTKFE